MSCRYRSSQRIGSLPKLVPTAAGCLEALLAADCAPLSVQTVPPVDRSGRYIALTLPVIALGDAQEHDLTGFPVPDNDGAIDEKVPA